MKSVKNKNAQLQIEMIKYSEGWIERKLSH